MSDLVFHSFPRARRDETRLESTIKGVRIADSLLKNGLLLAPENFDIPLLNEHGVQDDSISFLQSRICFTEIPTSELREHSSTFGEFSLIYDIDDLRRIGGLPVHYVPMPIGSHLYGLGAQIIGGLADAARVLDTIVAMRQQMETSPTLRIQWTRTIDGQTVGDGVRFTEEQTTILRSFFDEFESICASPLVATRQKLLAAAACFYPTEHPARGGRLHYYRQREWRVVECGLLNDGAPLAPRATNEQVETLHGIDSDFFSKTINVPSERKIGGWQTATLADRCRFLSRVADLDVVGLARFLVVPDDLADGFEHRADFERRGVKVVTARELQDSVEEPSQS